MAILDMNEELAQDVVKQIGGGKTKFFEANVLETGSIEAAVKGVVSWSKETGKEIGGVIAAAGVSTPAKVSICFQSHTKFLWRSCSLGITHRVTSTCIACVGQPNPILEVPWLWTSFDAVYL